MEPDISQEQAQWELEQIRTYLRETGEGVDVANEYVQSLGFPDYRTFVYFAQNGVTPDQDPDQRQAEVGRMGAMRRFGEGLLAGIPFSDEIAGIRLPHGIGPQVAGQQAATGVGPSYDQAMVDRIRGRREVLRDEYPGAMLAAETIPGLMIPAAGASLASSRAAAVGARPIIAAMAGAGAGGALEGSVFGFSEGEGMGNRMLNAGLGGLFGGAVGGTFGLGMGAASAAGRRVARGISESAGERQGRMNAGRWFRRWFDENPEIDPNVIDRRLAELGPEAVVADAAPVPGGRGIYAARSLAGGSLDMPGGPSQRMAGRAMERGDRLQRDLMSVADQRGIPVEGRVDQAGEALRAKAQTDYYGPIDEAFGEISPAQARPIVQLFQDDPAIARYAVDVIGSVERPLRFSDFQALRNAMKESLERMKGDPQANIGAREALERQVNALTQAMHDTFGDGVAKADRLWARAGDLTRGYEAGLKLGANNSPLAVQRAMAQEWGNATPEVRMAVLAGVVDRLGQKIIDSPTGGSAGSKVVNEARGMREWLVSVLGQDGYNALEGAIQREQAFQTTHNYAGLNSLTAMRGEDIAGMREQIARPGVNRWEWMRKVGEWFTDTSGLERSKGRAIGEALMAGDTGPLRELLERDSRAFARVGPGTGETTALVSAGLASPLNRYLLGLYLVEENR